MPRPAMPFSWGHTFGKLSPAGLNPAYYPKGNVVDGKVRSVSSRELHLDRIRQAVARQQPPLRRVARAAPEEIDYNDLVTITDNEVARLIAEDKQIAAADFAVRRDE